MNPPIPLFEAGPFDVFRVVATGGMSQVWLGRHRVHGTEAAIKVVRSNIGDDLARRLRVEVRAMAGLDHPRVAAVLDTGTLDRFAEADSGGQVTAGSPWLAMTWVPHGDLQRLRGAQPWKVTRALLLDVLEALAHAHARGVVHRDLKPGNVLLRVEGDVVRAVLTDFGIAQVFDPHGDEPTLDQRVAGTPEYMAPEQIRGRWRDVGPWTDLYALGCLAWELATGEPPYIGESAIHITLKHLSDPLPPLVLGADYPHGFSAWLHRLLAKDPYARFERAADAASALDACDPGAENGTDSLVERLTGERISRPPPGDRTTPAVHGEGSPSHLALVLGKTADDISGQADTWLLPAFDTDPGERPGPATLLPIDGADGAPVRDVHDTDAEFGGAARPEADSVPVPDDWRQTLSRRGVVGRAGPGLFGLRPLPMVGRIEDRDRLWRRLNQAWRLRRPQLCVLESSAGFGRHRLAEWLTRRADELGAASVLRATHGPIPARRDGLGATVLEWFRAAGADDVELAARIDADFERRADDADPTERRLTRDALVDLARRGSLAERTGQRERQIRAFARWLRWNARRRPLILRLDNAHWSTTALAMAGSLAEQPDLPLLILLTLPSATARGHVGAERVAALEQLMAIDGLDRISLGPLSDGHMRTLLVDGVGLAPALAGRLALASSGNSLFAVQVVAEWLADGALRPGRLGMVPVGPHMPPVPEDWHALGTARIDRVIQASGVDEEIGWQAMEAAAMLGEAVADDDWASVTAADREALTALTVALLDAGLARPADGGWSFVRPFVRDALVARARDGGRARRLALYCALSVIDADPEDPRPAERRARYLLDGGHRLEAVEAYIEAARRSAARGVYRAAATLLDTADAVFAAAGLDPTDIRRGRLLAIRAEVARFTGQSDLAEAALSTLRRMPRLPERPWARAELARLDGQQAFYEGAVDVALGRWSEAEQLFKQAGDPEGAARCLHGQGWALCSLGEVIAAHAHFERGRALAEGASLALQGAWCLHGIAVTRIWGDRPGGLTLVEDASARFEQLGQRAGHGLCDVHRADALWTNQRPADARQALDRAVSTLRGINSNLLPDALARRAILALESGELDAARADATEVEQRWLDELVAGHRFAAVMVLAELEMHAGRTEAGTRLFDRAAALADVALFASPANGRLLLRIAECLAPDDAPRAVRALTLARRIVQPLDPRRAAQIARRLRALRGATRG